MRAGGSRNFGEGSKRGVESDSERVFDFWGVRIAPGPNDPSSCPCGIVMSMVAVERSAASDAVAASSVTERATLCVDYGGRFGVITFMSGAFTSN